MAAGGLRRLLRSPVDRYAEGVSAAVVAELGWTALPGESWSTVWAGRDADGNEFTVRARFRDDGVTEFLEWRCGELRLDELVLAIANAPVDRSSEWLQGVEVEEGLAHDDPDPGALRDSLNRRAAEGASVSELNELALRLGAGGVAGVVMRFAAEAVEVDSGVPGLHALARTPRDASGVLTQSVQTRLAAVAAHTGAAAFGTPTFAAFVGRPFSKVSIEVRGTTIELLRDLAELGSELRVRVAAARTT